MIEILKEHNKIAKENNTYIRRLKTMSIDSQEEVCNAEKILESKVHEQKLIINGLNKHISDLTEKTITSNRKWRKHKIYADFNQSVISRKQTLCRLIGSTDEGTYPPKDNKQSLYKHRINWTQILP
ncbi:hypothetical protein JTB14_038466 [Gonioctena quinquepunctata]|nr:hypothetical protein JTB14_038466 [Gonioctena quinquepunctata]